VSVGPHTIASMGEVVELAAWTSPRGGTSPDGSVARARPAVARVRPIIGPWHPSLGPTAALPGVSPSPPADLADPIGRLERAVNRIDEITAKFSPRGSGMGSNVETELLALVGEISLGLIDDAADRAERLASGLGGAASSGP
jgi:hypothetical protein